jgi:hypothetical protein
MNNLFQIVLFFLAFMSFGFTQNTTNRSSTISLRSGFIENKGQIIDQNGKPNPVVLYLLNTPGMNVQLRKGGFSYDLYTPKSPEGDLFCCAGVPLNPLKGTYSAAQVYP